MFFPKRFSTDAIFLFVAGLVFFLLRFPSLYEPYWYGDEGIYFTIGRALRAGRELYTGIWDNKPPLLYWLYTAFNDLFSIRFVSLLFGLIAVFVFFFLSRKLIPAKYAYIATLLFSLLLALPTIEGNIANAENFMLLPVVGGALLFWSAREKVMTTSKQRKTLLAAGILLGIAFLFKTVALFDFLAFFFCGFLFISEKTTPLHRVIRTVLRTYGPYLVGFLLPIALICLLFLLKGVLPEFLSTILLENASYVGEKNNFIIPQGYLIIKLCLLLLSLTVLYRLKTRLHPPALFLLSWVAFSFFNAFFSQRPYVHYQLVLLPSLTLAVGFILSLSSRKVKTGAVLAFCGALVLLYTTFPHWKTNQILPYYGNFVAYLNGQKSIAEYLAFFDRNTPRDYALADYLRLHTKPNEEIFLWGDSAQIYYLSHTLPAGRYAVSYHIVTKQAIDKTVAQLKKNPPKMFLILPGTGPLPFTIPDYTYTLTIADTAIYERLN